MIRWVNEIFEVQAMDSPVRACERRKNPVEGQCSGANLSDIGTSCLDLRKKSLFFGLVRGFSLLSVAAMQWVFGTVGCIRSCCTWNWRDKLIGRTFIIRDALWIVGHGRSVAT